MEEKQYTVGANLLQELVNYLGTRPYAEVGGLVNKIMTLANQQSPQAATAPAAPVAEQIPVAPVEAVEPAKKRGRRKLAVVAEENNGTVKS